MSAAQAGHKKKGRPSDRAEVERDATAPLAQLARFFRPATCRTASRELSRKGKSSAVGRGGGVRLCEVPRGLAPILRLLVMRLRHSQ